MRKTFLIPLIIVSVLFVAALVFGGWAFTSRQDYKNNTDKKVAAAVDVAKQQVAAQKDKEFVEKEKLPLRTYTGPSAYGSLTVKYPKTWSAYVVEQPNGGSTPVDGYFNPSFVPGTNLTDSIFALRVQVVGQSYNQVIQQYQSNVKAGKLKASPYIPAHNKTVTGMRFDGALNSKITGSMIVLPLRDKTIKISTESPTYLKDFNNNILPNFSFDQ